MKDKLGLFALTLLLLSNSILFAEKVLIFTYSYNRPDFIVLQHKTFQNLPRVEGEGYNHPTVINIFLGD